MKVPARGFTHGGKFHADDVFATALLRILRPDFKVQRGFEVPDDFDGIVYDIGGGMFDHHDADRPERPNGVPYAAFGLLWRAFGEQLLRRGCSPEEAAREAAHFDEKFIQPLDLDDNTGCGSELASAVGAFNPAWDSDVSADERYFEAVDFACGILKRKLEEIWAVCRASARVRELSYSSAIKLG